MIVNEDWDNDVSLRTQKVIVGIVVVKGWKKKTVAMDVFYNSVNLFPTFVE